MSNRKLLIALKALVEIDHAILHQPTSDLYKKRALALKKLGLKTLAMQDNRLAAYLEQQNDLEIYNKNDIDIFSEEDKVSFYSEQGSFYYFCYINLLKSDELLINNQLSLDDFYYQTGYLGNLGLFDLALRYYDIAIECAKNSPKKYAEYRASKGCVLRLIGDLTMGWELHEDRFHTTIPTMLIEQIDFCPYWKGESLVSKKLLICGEQGFGDDIQFIRYAIYLKQQGVNVVVLSSEALYKLFKYNLEEYGIPVITDKDNIICDYWVSAMSLPFILGTTFQNIPLSQGYLIPSLIYSNKWEKQISKNTHFKVGLVWKGNPNHSADRFRSIPLALFKSIFNLNVEIHCLQKDLTQDEIILLEQYHNIHYWHNLLEDYQDTAAIIAQMDLIITVDTSVAHLAGAIGKATWVLLNYVPDWRWLFVGERTDWYDSIRLFRQDLDYQWEPVLVQVKETLSTYLNRKE